MNGAALRCLVGERTGHKRGLTQSLLVKGQQIAVAAMGLTRSQPFICLVLILYVVIPVIVIYQHL